MPVPARALLGHLWGEQGGSARDRGEAARVARPRL